MTDGRIQKPYTYSNCKVPVNLVLSVSRTDRYRSVTGVTRWRRIGALSADFQNAEWGFALASECWGTGMFVDGARLALEFVFQTIGVHRLEARAALANGRGNGALLKIGAKHEGVLRQSFPRRGAYLDQALWTILETEWRRAKAVWTA